MDIQHLKMILEAVGSASEGAKTFGLSWLVLDFINSFMGWAVLASVVFLGYKTLDRVIPALHRIRILRNVVLPHTEGYITESEFLIIKKALEDHMKGKIKDA